MGQDNNIYYGFYIRLKDAIKTESKNKIRCCINSECHNYRDAIYLATIKFCSACGQEIGTDTEDDFELKDICYVYEDMIDKGIIDYDSLRQVYSWEMRDGCAYLVSNSSDDYIDFGESKEGTSEMREPNDSFKIVINYLEENDIEYILKKGVIAWRS